MNKLRAENHKELVAKEAELAEYQKELMMFKDKVSWEIKPQAMLVLAMML